MFLAFFVFIISICELSNGHPFEVPKSHENSKFFHNSRIVGGVDAPEGYGKHMAALIFGHQWVIFICGGSIISKQHILTAAHCIDMLLTWDRKLPGSFRAIIGTKKWSTGTKELDFIDYVLHSGWDWDTIKNDIGILKVAEEIKITETVDIIPLKFDWVDGGMESYVTGWGLLSAMFNLPDNLQLLYVRTLTHKECEERIRVATETIGPAPLVQKDIEICTLYSPGHGMCNGDSGSALVKKDSQEQIGIVSWGFPCAHGVPDVFVRISGFKDWLLYNTQTYLA